MQTTLDHFRISKIKATKHLTIDITLYSVPQQNSFMIDTSGLDIATTLESNISSDLKPKDFCLRPVGLGCERLRQLTIPIQRSEAACKSNELAIGRTAVLAGDYHDFISRQHILVKTENGKLYICSRAQPGCVHVNGSAIAIGVAAEIFEGDVISLLGPKKYFNFEISIIDHVLTPPAKKRASDKRNDVAVKKRRSVGSESNSVSMMESDSVKSTAECSICLELMALSYSVVPCGHSFCYVCITDWMKQNKKCPTCSTPVANSIPCRMLDDIIRATVVTKNSIDVTAFERRYEEGMIASKKKIGTIAQAASKPVAKGKISSFFDVVDLS